ncbi:MAG: ATP-binding protein [Alphaproteobacteria bacterium]|nr:ATP-binding protein [Alphaproteobacteria bacterium]
MADDPKQKPPHGQCSACSARPPLCERYPGCIFFNDKMANMPETAEATKDQFCRSNYPSCARYILQSIWKLKAPDDMYPYQMARGQAILDALATEKKGDNADANALATANRTIRLLINALGHGYMMLDRAGLCLPTYSKACEALLEIEPTGKQISEILRLDPKQKATMQSALKLVFNQTHAMSFYEIMRFVPKVYYHSSGSIIKLTYKPDRLPNGALDRIILIATDVTEQVHQQESAEERRALFESLEQIFRDRAFFGSHIRRLNELLTTLRGQGPQVNLENLRREIHTMKGDAGIFKLNKIAQDLHDLETTLEPFETLPSFSFSDKTNPSLASAYEIRDRIAQEVTFLSAYLHDLLGMDITRIEAERNFDKKVLYAFSDVLAQKGQNELRELYLRNVCAESLRTYLKRYDTVLADLAGRFNKKVKPILFVDEDIPVIVDFYRDLLDSFIHLFRNTIDHGIERPDDRQAKGKAPAAQISIGMKINMNRLVVTISDDGAGVDTAKLRKKLTVKYHDIDWNKRNDQEILEDMLTHAVSSRDQVSLYSGRGIGMGTVVAQVKAIGGTLKVSSVAGQGTIIAIDIPYILDTPKT